MIDKKRNIFIKYESDKKFWKFSNKKKAELSTKPSLKHLNNIGFEDIANYFEHWLISKYRFNKAQSKLSVDDFCKSFFFLYIFFYYL